MQVGVLQNDRCWTLRTQFVWNRLPRLARLPKEFDVQELMFLLQLLSIDSLHAPIFAIYTLSCSPTDPNHPSASETRQGQPYSDELQNLLSIPNRHRKASSARKAAERWCFPSPSQALSMSDPLLSSLCTIWYVRVSQRMYSNYTDISYSQVTSSPTNTAVRAAQLSHAPFLV